ncbi:MAG: efflux RND transporter periplasmic adaptor subunit [Gemmatimonadota bacterium]
MSGLGSLGSRFMSLGSFARVALILGFGVAVFALLMLLREEPESQEPARRAPLVVTQPAELRSGNLTIEGNGTVRPMSEISLSPQVSGRITWVSPSFVTGGRFEKGDVLLRIEAADYENAVQAAEADVAQREVDLLTWKEQRDLAIEEYERFRAREGITAPVDSSEIGGLVFRDPQLRAAEASLRRAEAGLEDARLALSRTRLTAPFDGIVRTKSADIGQYVTPGQSLGSLYDTDEVEIVVPLTDGEAALIEGLWSAGSDADPTIPAEIRATFGGEEYTWTGYVDRAEGALNPNTRTVDVVVRVRQPFADDGKGRPPLLLGTYATVDIEGRAVEDFLVLPRMALRDGSEVYVVEQDSLLSIRSVQVLQEVTGNVMVKGEIGHGEPVVVNSMDVVTDGMIVRQAEESTS